MKGLAKQDRNGTRSSEELRRRYRFDNIELSLEEIEELKKIIVVDDFLSTTSTNAVQNKVITQALNNKVNKETGKGLSTNDFTDEMLDKVENIPENIETTNNKTTDISATSTDEQYPSAKAVYEAIQEGGGGVSGDTLPIGSIVDYEGESIPTNWVEVHDETKSTLKILNTAGWYRVAKYNNGQNSIAFTMNINSRFSNNNNQSTSINVNLTYQKAKLTYISNLMNSHVVPNIRAVLEDGNIYIEIYYNFNNANPVAIDILSQDQWDATNITMLNFEAPTDTAKVLDELVINSCGLKQLTMRNILVNSWSTNGVNDIFKDRNIVHFNISVRYGTTTVIMILPEEFRPIGDIIVPIVTTGGKSSYIIVSSTGEVTCTSEMIGQSFMANCTWVTNE